MNDPIGLGALNPRQQVGHDGLTMGILQKVTARQGSGRRRHSCARPKFGPNFR